MPRLKRMTLDRLGQDSHARFMRDAPDAVALDTETEGVAFYDRPFCLTATWRNRDGLLEDGYWELDEEGAPEMVFEILLNTPTWIFHNAKFDLQKLLLEGLAFRLTLDTKTIHDTEALFHLMHNVDRKGLKILAEKYLGGKGRRVPEKKLKSVRRKLNIKKEDGYLYLPREYVVPYAMADTRLTYELFEYGWPKLPASLLPLYEAEQELCLVLLDMERAGMRLDMEYLRAKQPEYGQLVMASLSVIRKLTGKEDLNPASPKQLQAAFKERGLSVDSTNAETLIPLDDELAKAVMEYRFRTKMFKTYFTGLMQEQRDGIIHPSFRQHGARTGRMSSGKATGD